MTSIAMHDGRVVLHQADCRDVLRGLADNSIDSVVTDPPYALVSIQKRFGKPGSAPVKIDDPDKSGCIKAAYARASAGFMGKQWDTGEVAFSEEFWAEVLRVLKPGGHVVAFSGTRTYHRMAVAIEDAGFEIRDQLGWVYGSGFPKSHDVSKGIDRIIKRVGMFGPFAEHYAERRKAAGLTHHAICAAGSFFAEHNHGGASANWEKGHNVPTLEQWLILKPLLGLSDEFLPLIERVEAEREKVGERRSGDPVAWFAESDRGDGVVDITLPGTEESAAWQGWGTALKPAWEPICLARKPLIGTVAENVLEHGTGAINIDGSRVPGGDEHALGRWPANIVHDGSEEVLAAFPDMKSGSRKAGEYGLMGYHGADAAPMPAIDGDPGSAARFFYCAKASRADRDAGLEGFAGKSDSAHRKSNIEETGDNPYLRGVTVRKNSHPTVKPTTLMQWLCRLVTPPGGVILDPFMGSGSTGKAAVLEGFQFIGCEREDEYMPIAAARIAWAIGAVSKGEPQPLPEERPAVAPQRPAANDNTVADLFSKEAA